MKSGSDAWCYNASKPELEANMRRMIDFYNEQLEAFQRSGTTSAKDFVDYDRKKISWSRGLLSDTEKGKSGGFSQECVYTSHYRPFCKQSFYFSRQFNDMVYRQFEYFPTPDSENRVICLTGPGAGKEYSALIVDAVPNLHFMDTSQCFPLYIYDKATAGEMDFGQEQSGRRVNISDHALKTFQAHYKDTKIGKEDIFYYVYGILHSPEYKSRFKADLKKMLPRIPQAKDFWAFSKAGRKLADIHLGYESAKPYPLNEHADSLALDEVKLYRVEKMRFGKKDKKVDKTVIHYNAHVTLSGIPKEAYTYQVNGKSAIEWIMDRYQISVHKDSGIRNDPNDWSLEHNQPRYIIDLLKRVVAVSLETNRIIKELPDMGK